jgi:hypothetical protein
VHAGMLAFTIVFVIRQMENSEITSIVFKNFQRGSLAIVLVL